MNSEVAHLRKELLIIHQENLRLKEFVTSMNDVHGKAIIQQTERLNREYERAERLQSMVTNLQKRRHIEESWNGRPSESKEYGENRAKFRAQVNAYKDKSEQDKSEQDKDATNGKKIGGQLGHTGISREGKCEKTIFFKAETCPCCGRTDLYRIKCVRKRVLGNDKCYMHVMYVVQCPLCKTITEPETDAIKGSAFLTEQRAITNTYTSKGVSISNTHDFLKELHDTYMSSGAISNCTAAMADMLDCKITCMPAEAPIILDELDLRMWRTPVKPHDYTFDYHYDNDNDKNDRNTYVKSDELLTRYGTVWASLIVQPFTVRIMNVASMDPYSETDESPHHVLKEKVQVLVASTRRTTQIDVVNHKNIDTVHKFLGWMIDRFSIRDGFPGYGWHRMEHQRCAIHVNRKVEDAAMTKGIDSDECVRYMMMLEIYHDSKEAAAKITEMAGGPIKEAYDLDIVNRTPDLLKIANEMTAKLENRINMAANMMDDSAATTIKNAASNLCTSIKYPGAPLHTNNVERIIRTHVVARNRRPKGPFPNWRAAYKFSILQTFAATCAKNGISVYAATIQMAKNHTWDMFTSGIPPPIISSRQQCLMVNTRP